MELNKARKIRRGKKKKDENVKMKIRQRKEKEYNTMTMTYAWGEYVGITGVYHSSHYRPTQVVI